MSGDGREFGIRGVINFDTYVAAKLAEIESGSTQSDKISSVRGVGLEPSSLVQSVSKFRSYEDDSFRQLFDSIALEVARHSQLVA